MHAVPFVKKISLILVVPFYNEANNLPYFTSSLKKNKKIDSVYLLGVNHNSTDNSAQIFQSLASSFGRTDVLLEKSSIAVGGIPRSTGFKRATILAQKEAREGRKIIVGSIDADTIVSSSFVSEAQSFAESGKDFLIFPARFNQKTLVHCIDLQSPNAKKACAQTLVGIDWLYFQLRDFLVQKGAIETRGSGGYFFTLEGFRKAQGHHQTFSRDGLVLTGENNAIGMRAKHNNATCTVGISTQLASPRRNLNAIAKNVSSYGKTFSRTESTITFPILSNTQWNEQFCKSLEGILFTFVHKALAYEISEKVIDYFPKHFYFSDFLQICLSLYKKTEFMADERYSASQQYFTIFDDAKRIIGSRHFANILELFLVNIPRYDDLVRWAHLDNTNLKIIDRIM